MRCALLDMGETEARVLQVLYHSLTGEPAAAVTARVEHVAPGELRPFAWSFSARRLAEGLMAEAPDWARPRGISDAPIESRASLAAADALGLLPTGAGALTPLECDARGRMRPDHLLERITNGLRHLRRPLQPSAGQAMAKPTLGGATVEFRALYQHWPRAGDCLALRSGLADLGPKSRRLAHWLLDPFTGKAWASAEMIVLFFDLETRRSTEPPPELAQALERLVIPGLSL
jgi:acyl-CoA thioester hydrolase